jgi:hypothetical protein
VELVSRVRMSVPGEFTKRDFRENKSVHRKGSGQG